MAAFVEFKYSRGRFEMATQDDGGLNELHQDPADGSHPHVNAFVAQDLVHLFGGQVFVLTTA